MRNLIDRLFAANLLILIAADPGCGGDPPLVEEADVTEAAAAPATASSLAGDGALQAPLDAPTQRCCSDSIPPFQPPIRRELNETNLTQRRYADSIPPFQPPIRHKLVADDRVPRGPAMPPDTIDSPQPPIVIIRGPFPPRK